MAQAALMTLLAIPSTAQKNAASAGAEAQPQAVTGAARNSGPELLPRNPRYRLRKSDSFNVEFAFSPEFDQVVEVQPDGYVSLKGVGSIFVEGQTVPELTETVKTAYKGILHDPMVAIFLKDFEKPYFIAGGQVQRPGKYDLRSALTVSEAVAIAGGFNDKAKHSQVVLYHPLPSGGFDAKLLNIKKLLAKRDLSEDVEMQPGDMLYVPQSAYSKVRQFLPSPYEVMGAVSTAALY
jgi:polysaccharide export outer membrane protein